LKGMAWGSNARNNRRGTPNGGEVSTGRNPHVHSLYLACSGRWPALEDCVRIAPLWGQPGRAPAFRAT